jgi:biotin synthase-related radical SAM superfamily protein
MPIPKVINFHSLIVQADLLSPLAPSSFVLEAEICLCKWVKSKQLEAAILRNRELEAELLTIWVGVETSEHFKE